MAKGGAMGAALGPATVLGMRGLQKGGQITADVTAGIPGAQRVGQVIGATTGATLDYTKRAQEKLLQAFQRDHHIQDDGIFPKIIGVLGKQALE